MTRLKRLWCRLFDHEWFAHAYAPRTIHECLVCGHLAEGAYLRGQP